MLFTSPVVTTNNFVYYVYRYCNKSKRTNFVLRSTKYEFVYCIYTFPHFKAGINVLKFKKIKSKSAYGLLHESVTRYTRYTYTVDGPVFI